MPLSMKEKETKPLMFHMFMTLRNTSAILRTKSKRLIARHKQIINDSE